jgi:hypothetical protein
MVTLMSYHGTCCIAVNVNAAAVPDNQLFMQCMEEGLAEITALALKPRQRATARGASDAA